MLNKVLRLLEARGVFTTLGPEATRRLVIDIEKLSRDHDCNSNEILEGMEERLGICWSCMTAQTDLIDGMCASCREQEERVQSRYRSKQPFTPP